MKSFLLKRMTRVFSEVEITKKHTMADSIEEHLLFRPQIRQDIFAFSNLWDRLGSLTALELTSGWLGDDWGVHLNGLWRWWMSDTSQWSSTNLGEWGAWYDLRQAKLG